jgi:hypothetical protein
MTNLELFQAATKMFINQGGTKKWFLDLHTGTDYNETADKVFEMYKKTKIGGVKKDGSVSDFALFINTTVNY